MPCPACPALKPPVYAGTALQSFAWLRCHEPRFLGPTRNQTRPRGHNGHLRPPTVPRREAGERFHALANLLRKFRCRDPTFPVHGARRRNPVPRRADRSPGQAMWASSDGWSGTCAFATTSPSTTMTARVRAMPSWTGANSHGTARVGRLLFRRANQQAAPVPAMHDGVQGRINHCPACEAIVDIRKSPWTDHRPGSLLVPNVRPRSHPPHGTRLQGCRPRDDKRPAHQPMTGRPDMQHVLHSRRVPLGRNIPLNHLLTASVP